MGYECRVWGMSVEYGFWGRVWGMSVEYGVWGMSVEFGV